MHRTARCTRAYASRFDFPRARAWSFVTTNSRKLASKFFRAGSGVDDVEVEGRDDARVTASSTTASTTASTTVRSASSSTTSPTASSIALIARAKRGNVPCARGQTMAFQLNPLVAALPVLGLGHGACSAVATSGRSGDRDVLEAEPAAEVRARHTADAVCCHAPASCSRAPRVGGLVNIIHWHLSWQATILRTMPTGASVPGRRTSKVGTQSVTQ